MAAPVVECRRGRLHGRNLRRARLGMSRNRILFLAEGATMAHFVRPLALADSLDTSRYDVHFYAPSRFSGFLKDKPFAIGELRGMPGERFLENTARGAPVFPADVIRGDGKHERSE